MTARDDIDAPLRDALADRGLDTVDGAFAFDAGEDLDKPGLGSRRRTRLAIPDAHGREHTVYLKRYGPPTPGQCLAALRRHGHPWPPGRIEYENVRRARLAGVPTMRAPLWGQDGGPTGGRSYVVVTAVAGDAMERCFADFLRRHVGDGAVEDVTGRLAELVRTLHRAGYVHRDLYASHVFLDESHGAVRLHLIDLARMFRPRLRLRRWLVKDLAALKFSMPAAWVDEHWPAFLAAYVRGWAAPPPGGLDAAVERKAAWMRRRAARKARRRQAETS